MAFGSLNLNITANIAGLNTALRQATRNVRQFSNSVNSYVSVQNGIRQQQQALQSLNRNLREYGFNWASVKRIVSGIVIAQVFYKALGAIQDSTSATFEFANDLEYAHVAFSNLFNDTALSEEFINVLKDFAAVTPFNFTESEEAAKRLLAYGVQYKNVMYVMQGVMSAAAMQGDPAKVEAISRALGQIYTKGRLMSQEMTQLTEAGIPAWEILQEKIGLTKDQIGDIGNLKIPAATAINALVDGMTDRFGNVVTASSRTLTGIISNIQDNALMISAEVFQPLIGQIKAVADALGQWLLKLREIMGLKGLGGVFESIVPPEAQQAVRTFLANLMNLWTVVKYFLASAFEAFKNVLFAVINAFNVLAPPIIIIGSLLSRFIYYVTSNTTAMRILSGMILGAATAFVIFKLRALAALATAVLTKVIYGLARAFLFLAMVIQTNPILFLIGALTASIVGLSVAAGGATGALGRFFKNLTSLGGVNPDNILPSETQERASDLNKFNNALEDTNEGLDDANDKTKKLKKNADNLKKSLLSFDEVFRLNDSEKNSGSTGAGDDDSTYTYDPTAGLGGLDASTLIPEIPDMTGFGKDFVDSLFKSIKDAFGTAALKKILDVGLGAGIGAVIGGLAAGPIGVAIGALAGAIVGYIWDTLADALGLSKTTRVSMAIGTLLGGALGAIIGGPAGAAVGVAVGSLVGWVVGLIIDGFQTGTWDTTGISLGIGTLIGLGIGGVMGGAPGAIIGASIGTMVGWVIGQIIEGFRTGKWDTSSLSISIGGLIGGAIGAIIGGPGGAVVGTGIGMFAGQTINKLIKGFTTGNWDVSAISVSIGGLVGGAIGGVMGGAPGAAVGLAIGTLAGWVVNKIIDSFGVESLSDFDFTPISMGLGSVIGGAIGGAIGGPPGALIGIAIGTFAGWVVGKINNYLIKKFTNADWAGVKKAFVNGLFGDGGIFGWSAQMFSNAGKFFKDAWKAFKEQDWEAVGENILLGILNGLAGAFTFIWEPIGRLFKAIYKGICKFFGIESPAKKMKPIGKNILLGILEGIVEAFTKIPSYVAKTGRELIKSFKSWFGEEGLSGKIGTWMSEGKKHVTDFVSNTKNSISTWYSNTKTKFTTWASEVGTTFDTWKTDTKVKFDTWKTDTKAKFDTWVTDTKTKFTTWKTETKAKFDAWKTETKATFDTWKTDTKAKFDTWKTDTKAKFDTWKTDTGKTISSWASNTSSSVKTWWGDVKSKFDKFKETSFSKWSENTGKTISTWASNTYKSVNGWWGDVKGKFDKFKETSFSTWASNTYSTIATWADNTWTKIRTKIGNSINKIKEFLNIKDKTEGGGGSTGGSGSSRSFGTYSTNTKTGHATGGVFNREHYARFAEGNKAEAIIPLETESGMKPFVDAVASGVIQTIAPMLSGGGGGEQLQPLYVGTLIADDRSLKELERKMNVIRLQENRRR